jgi:hypothetical protein
VQPDQQLDQRVQQPVRELAAARVREQVPVRRRVVEEPGDQRRLRAGPVGHHAEHLDGRDAELLQAAQQAVLAPGQPLVDLLDGEDLAALDDEADHVPGQAALPDLDQPVVGPLRQRLVPGQRQQARRRLGRWREDETHPAISPARSDPP